MKLSKRIHIESYLVCLMVLFSQSVMANPANDISQRYALVIGNSEYEFSPLMNPVNDATDMATVLRENNFEVILHLNADNKAMREAINQFGARLTRDGGTGLFYFAGHGVQIKGRNYLIPVGSNIESESDVEYEAIDVGRVLGKMEDAENSLNIVILDACRNNPFARSFRSAELGLAKMDAPTGSIIAYATAPGSVAADGNERNGLYTKHLLKYINQPQLEIEDVFKRVRISVVKESDNMQVPWESSSLIGNFVLRADTVNLNINNTSSLSPATTANDFSPEDEYWSMIKDSTDPMDYQIYLENYNNGKFKALAQRKLRQFSTQKSATGFSLINGSWNSWRDGKASGTYSKHENGNIVWSYSIPAVNDQNFSGLSVSFDRQSFTDKTIHISLLSESAQPLVINLYAFIDGFSKEKDFDSLVPMSYSLLLQKGSNKFMLKAADFKIPQWWLEEHKHPSLEPSLDSIRTLEFSANPSQGPATDRVVISEIVLN